MKSMSRIAMLGVLSVGITGLGCTSDNEDIVKQQQKLNANAAPTAAAAPPPKSQAEYAKRQQQSQSYGKSSGYPGAK